MVGKTKRFNIERLNAIFNHILNIQGLLEFVNGEFRVYGHTLDYFSTINSLVDENLLKR